jgi:hypothetical protein
MCATSSASPPFCPRGTRSLSRKPTYPRRSQLVATAAFRHLCGDLSDTGREAAYDHEEDGHLPNVDGACDALPVAEVDAGWRGVDF